MSRGKVVVYLIRRDLRVADNPILHHLTSSSDHGYTHLLPVYIFDPVQIEISGFVKHGEASPYPEARSAVGGYWRTGPHRARFVAQSVWDLKQSLEQLNSGLLLRFGSPVEIVKNITKALKDSAQPVGGIYMTEEKSSEEVEEQRSIKQVCEEEDVDFRLWLDEKYYIDDRDTGLQNPKDLPDIFTSYRKMQEPLRKRPRTPLARPERAHMLPLPDYGSDTLEDGPFVIPRTQEDCEARMLEPLKEVMTNPPPRPDGVGTAHPFSGGETHGWERIEHLIKSGGMTTYKETRNGLLGPEFSTKLSAYLALGSITARQIHHELLKFEDGTDEKYKSGSGYGQGENDGTRGVRFELLWRDYMRLCTIKFGKKLFRLHGFREKDKYDREWKSADVSSAPKGQNPPPAEVAELLQRIFRGTTGLGLIDASQRELFHTGYTSNRARQNVASFLAKHLGIDWRYGAEWYEMLLVDYDVSSNWSNWQYVAGVGNDPRGDERNFNPVKQAFDYDKEGAYVRSWIPELKNLERLECVFQVSTAKSWELAKCGLENNIMATHPIKRIQFVPNRKPRPTGKPQWKGGWRGHNKRGGGGGGGGRGGGRGGSSNGDRSGYPDNGENQHPPNGHSGVGHDGTNGQKNTRGGTQHRGGHGGPTRGGESMRDALWFGETSSGKADGPSSDDVALQSDYHEQNRSQLPGPPPPAPPLPPQTTWNNDTRRSSHGGQQIHGVAHQGSHYRKQGGYYGAWRSNDRKQWTSGNWTGLYPPQGPPPPPPLPYGAGYLAGVSSGVYAPRAYGPAPVPLADSVAVPAAPQPWLLQGQHHPAQPIFPGYAEPIAAGGGFIPGAVAVVSPHPPVPAVLYHQAMSERQSQSQPQPQPQPQPQSQSQGVPLQMTTQKSAMSVEARPFVPGQSPDSSYTKDETPMIVQPEVNVVPPAWGSEGSDAGSSRAAITQIACQPAAVIAHSSVVW